MAVKSRTGQFVVATPARTVCDDNARALEKIGRLRFMALGTRRGIAGVPPERTRLFPAFGLINFIAGNVLPPYRAESFRFRTLPLFDRWAKRHLVAGDHIISSYGYANECFRWIRKQGGKTFVDAGNSHIENFWEIISEEHRRWGCSTPPFSPYWLERSQAMLRESDYVLSPSSFVTRSFLARGFKPEQMLKNVYPVDLSLFQPRTHPRPKNQPLTVINTGALSLRKGTPYLLEAFQIIRRKHPAARLLLTRSVRDEIRPILARYSDLPIEWAPSLPHAPLAERLRSADIFVLPSLEDGWARTVSEAMACGLPAVVTPNTGASDSVQPGVSGEVVPIRDAQAVADAVLKWAEIILQPGYEPTVKIDKEQFSFEKFEACYLEQLENIGLTERGGDSQA